MNKNRKAKLAQRALAYSNANQTMGADSFSWEDGYRAAMRDMRKVINQTNKEYPGSTTTDIIRRRHMRAVRIGRFLLPLR